MHMRLGMIAIALMVLSACETTSFSYSTASGASQIGVAAPAYDGGNYRQSGSRPGAR